MKEKQMYLAPDCEEYELRLEGVIATSDVASIAPGIISPFETEEIW